MHRLLSLLSLLSILSNSSCSPNTQLKTANIVLAPYYYTTKIKSFEYNT